MRCLLLLACVATGASSAIVLGAQQQPAFRAGVDVVAVSVTVTGPDGRFVAGLAADDFTVYEDGRAQEVIFFERATNPLTVSLLLDSSNSMTDQLELAQQAAVAFVARMRALDRVEVIDFDSRVRVLQPFTGDHEALVRAIRTTTSGGSTSLYEAIFIALGRLEGERSRAGNAMRREVLLVLSDGADNSPRVRFEQLMTMVKRFPTVIYTIGLGLNEPPNSRIFGRWAADSEANLRTLARETGGRLLVATQASDLSGVYAEIAEELNNQYLLGYAPSDPERPGWRSIAVTGPSSLQIRTRTGYTVAAP